ncbi:MAG: Gfo/Idh/MocA family oxidoreductase [Candidatus Hydrogenedentes bacterium]|nr:Gfo/Idh/MocA family oxidoreductase [Candidatus Hydrogenedentota bacterium]
MSKDNGVNKTSRRQFMASAAAFTAFTIVPRHVLANSGQPAPSDKLNIGCVGVGGMMGAGDVRGVGSENIYALCDVDENHLQKIAPEFPNAKHYRDFREMLDKEYKNLDAVTVTTPDHNHATIALRAMERGLSVHCQKPLTQTVWEARLMTKAAQKYNVVTQMGNQGYSCEATRRACEIIWSGVLGDITEVHSMSGGGFARGITAWPPAEEIPKTLEWDLWLGRTAEKPYSAQIHPINWRGFLDYGSQMIGDWGIHQLGPANWALQLGSPDSVECTNVEGVNPVTYPSYSCKMEFPERPNKYVPGGKMPPVSVFWYEGTMAGKFQTPEGLDPEEVRNFNEIFVGTKGCMGTKGRGEFVSLLPTAKMKGFEKPAPVLKRIPNGHYEDFLQACKGGEPPCSNFSIAGPFTEWLLLGSICWRFPNEKLLWDGPNLRFTNNEKANEFVKPSFRKGWELEDIIL